MKQSKNFMKNKSSHKLSIVMPVRNEGVNIKIMLQILNAVIEYPYETLIVCDTLEDDSIPVVKKLQPKYPNLKLVHNQLGRGVINAIKSGVNNASGDYILIFAVDEIGPVLAIEDMISLMEEEGCDLVSCTRYAHGGRRLGGNLIGGILSRLANRMFSYLCGSKFTDATTGIKMFKKSVFKELEFNAKPVGWAVVFEMAIKFQMHGCLLGEVPIVSIDRLYGGVSSFRLGPWVKEYLKWFFYGVRNLRSHKNLRDVKIKIPTTTIW